MPSTKSLVLALALTAPAAALVPPTTQRVPATIRHADDAARAARREALMQASERAAARIEATRNSGQSTPMRPDDMMAFVKPATEAQAPDEMSYVPTDDEGRANYAVGGGESGMDRSSMKERFSRAPEGHTPHYNTGEGYFADLTRDSSERHWTKNDGKTAGYDTIKRQFGQRPDEDIEIDMSDTFLVNQLKVGERYEVKPAWEVYYEKAIAEGRDTLEPPKPRAPTTPKPAAPSGYAAPASGAALEGEDQQVVQGALSALMQYAGSVQLDSPLPPQVQGQAARVAAIGPGFSQFAAAIEELACDGAFLASLSPAELDETFEDIGVTARLQRRRVAFALGLGK